MKTKENLPQKQKEIHKTINKIIEKRRCHLCESHHYIEKIYADGITKYRCTNCDNFIWSEKEFDYDMLPEVFFDEYKNFLLRG